MPAERTVLSIQVTLENDPRHPDYGRPVITRVVANGQDVTTGGKVTMYDDDSQTFIVANGPDSNWWALLVSMTSDTELDNPLNPWMQGDEAFEGNDDQSIVYDEPVEPHSAQTVRFLDQLDGLMQMYDGTQEFDSEPSIERTKRLANILGVDIDPIGE